MLVLGRKVGEQIHIGRTIAVTVLRIRGRTVRLGFTAPPEVCIQREEVYDKMVLEEPENGPPGRHKGHVEREDG